MSEDIDIRGTNLVNELVDNFNDELRNTPDFYKRREWHWKRVADILRRFDVVPTGKLRVVEEVEYLSDGGCSNCGNTIYSDAGIERPNADWFCPGCGNKIKRA
jgi:predicted RNA-binding Zn-ribbon protein involved in translation (DUF1610 family)